MIRQLIIPALLLSALTLNAKTSRTLNERFEVRPGVTIEVNINGGPITVEIGDSGVVEIELIQSVSTNDEAEAAELFERAALVIEQQGDRVRVITNPNRGDSGLRSWFRNNHVNHTARLTVPAEVNLNLDTSGGPITVNGLVNGSLRADTSGGGINVTGATGPLYLDTSGGAIRVDQAFSRVHADTSGGPIRIGYVGPDADDINADTSGGGINIGLDPAGGYDLYADTSGGRVSVNDLNFTARKQDRTHAEGQINDGGTRVRADTSGGGITIHAATP